MDEEKVIGIIILCLVFIVMVLSDTCLTKDDTKINLNKIDKMIKLCDNNGGLDYIEHDYDTYCKNGAMFDSLKDYKDN